MCILFSNDIGIISINIIVPNLGSKVQRMKKKIFFINPSYRKLVQYPL